MDDWNTVCQELGIDSDKTKSWWETVLHHYSEPWRCYHTMQHVNDMLSYMKQDLDRLENWLEVALAIFFHDIVYDPKSPVNEEKSAELFMVFSDECVKECSVVDPAKVQSMILTTKTHHTDAHDSDTYGTFDVHWLMDYDMSILGQDEEVYLQYAEAIRREYNHIPQLQYSERRSKVLESILASDKIYCTEKFHCMYEKKARKNILKELETHKIQD